MVFVHIQTLGEMFWGSVGLIAWDSNEAKSPSPGISCLDGGTLVSGPEFNPHVVCQGLFWEGRTRDRELWGFFEPVWQSQCEKHILCPSIFKEEKEKTFCYCWYAANWLFCTNCTGSTTLVLKGLRHKGNLALLLFPFTDRQLQPDTCIPAGLQAVRSILPHIMKESPTRISSSASLTTSPAPRSANSDFSYVWRWVEPPNALDFTSIKCTSCFWFSWRWSFPATDCRLHLLVLCTVYL